MDARRQIAALYQKSFDQIDATARALGHDGFVDDAPRDVPVFGLTVTLDLHLTTVIDGRTLSGIVMDYRSPTGPSAESTTPCRVIAANDFEVVADLLAWASPADVLAVLDRLFEASDTRSPQGFIRDQLGSRLPSDPPINPLIAESFERLADAVDTASLSDGIRSIAASLRS